jgi:hypothetical protein
VDRQIADAEADAEKRVHGFPWTAREVWADRIRRRMYGYIIDDIDGIEEEVAQEVLSGMDVETLCRKYPGIARGVNGWMAIELAGMQRAIGNTRSRCNECSACLAKFAPRKRGLNYSSASLPCESLLRDMSYTDSEREALYAFLCAQRPDHAYGFPSHKDLHAYILHTIRGVEV